MGTIRKLRDFFMFPKRKSILSKAIEISENNISKKSLKRNCETRWIERYHSVSDFLELFECVEEAHEEISQDTLIELEDYRKHAQKNFEDIFLATKKIADKFNVTITIPRINKRQVHRINVQTNDPDEYFRISVFIPYLDSFIKEEFQLWQRKLKKLEMKPKNSIDALKLCNSDIYPGVNKLFQILATLPISTASNERTFSSLKTIKTYLRNTISEKRLNGLAMLNIHRGVEITVDEVIAELAKQSR
ncbi:hypothetical protein AGLY_003262 [Aphis glycines]|uniref:HAT C-terminal dimerisation domain-containing protein n=1 Tax=Aphis glycines TaxID=307491 RepID=A0A6G0U2K6_APHGL|nr:hypothetical protein AGLY_003262 [Aphis glycines]